MDIIKKAMHEAIVLLKSAGARYHVIEADGTVHGEPIEPEKKRKTRSVDPNAPSYHAIFVEKLQPMKVGEVVKLDPAENDTMRRLQMNTGAFCLKRFGKGNYMTTQHQGRLEVLRKA